MLNFIYRNKLYALYIPLYIYWIIIFALSSVPNPDMPRLLNTYDDKLKHFLAYGVLAFLLYITNNIQQKYRILKKWPVILTILIVSLYGLFDEIHQIFIPGRFFDMLDLAADVLGAIVGTYCGYWFIRSSRTIKPTD